MTAIGKAQRAVRHMLDFGLVLTWLLAVSSLLPRAGLNWWRLVPALIALVAFSWCYLRMTRAVLQRRYARREAVAGAALAAAAAVLGGAHPIGFGFVPIAWVSVAQIGVSKRAMLAMTSITFAAWSALAVFELDVHGSADLPLPLLMLFALLMCASLGPSNRLWVWIWTLAVQAEEGKEARAQLAVAEERLRFARDLHDLVGHQLSAIAVKTELAVRLTRAGKPEAADELSEVHGLTRQALKELREAVRGYRDLDFSAELASVRSVLEAAGVRCELQLPYRDVPGEVAPVFAYVVREAVTNVLKHSDATRCAITVQLTGDEAVLEVRNDGVTRRAHEDLGSGLRGLTERLQALHGALVAKPVLGGEFVLTASVPVLHGWSPSG